MVNEAHVLPMIDLFRPAKHLDIFIALIGLNVYFILTARLISVHYEPPFLEK